MNNLVQIVIVAAWLSLPVSLWVVVYFAVRIYLRYRIWRDLDDMPSAERIAAHYAWLNFRNGGVDQHPR